VSKPTGGKPGRPPTPAAVPRAPRPADPIAAIVWDMEVEAAKEKPNATKAGLLGKQLEALTRAQDRADTIASDEQRIELEAARISIDELNAECDESEATISSLQQDVSTFQQTVTTLESKITDVIAAAAEDRQQYLAQCPACVAAAVTISGLQQETVGIWKPGEVLIPSF
jgi:chromosome segregation ATPase